MALVAYDYDSTSENEEEDEEENAISVIIPNKKLEPQINGTDLKTGTSNEISHELVEGNKNLNLFSTLPETKTSVKEVVEDTIEDFIPKPPLIKKKERVKITIPSLSEFNDINDDDEPEIKKIKPSVKGSGLMSLLPPVRGAVKSATSFIPKVISDKTKVQATSTSTRDQSTRTNSLVPNSIRKNAAKKSAILLKQKQKQKIALSDAESDDDLEMPETFDDEMWEKVCGRPKSKPIIQESEPEKEETFDIAPEPEQPYEGLDNKAFKELVGKSRRPIGNIKLIDINEEEILADKDLWMAKSLTDPDMAPRAVVDDPVDTTRRKKHHITYLAQQAKANEQDLKNAWAVSKNNKMASRSKYGF